MLLLLLSLLQELEAATSGSKFSSSKIPPELRGKAWDFLQGLPLATLPADQLKQLVLHAPPWEDDPDFSTFQHSGFLLSPPIPRGGEGRKRSKGGEAGPTRNFTSYSANPPFPVDGESSEEKHLICCTCPVSAPTQQQPPAQQPAGQQQQVATYRLYACVFVGERPEGVDGHKWQPVELKSGKEGWLDTQGHLWQEVKLKSSKQGWLDTSVALGVWEPLTAERQHKRQRTR